MGNIIMHGSLGELKTKLRRMQHVIRFRVSYGWRPWQHDEEWTYVTMEDLKVCKRCAPLHGNVYRGDYVLATFKYAVKTSVGAAQVNMHPKCRCRLAWLNKHEVLVERLHEELQEAMA